MTQREVDIKSIVAEFTLWQTQLQNLGSLNLFDSHVVSEHTVCELLNAVFDYNLQSANRKHPNHPAVDLVDDTNGIAVQVTAKAGLAKIQRTLDVFKAHDLSSRYPQLVILVMGKKQRTYRTLKIPEYVSFRVEDGVVDFQDLLRFISCLPSTRVTRIRQIIANANKIPSMAPRRSKAASRVKRNLALKKRLQRDLVMKLDRQLWEHSWYEPWIKFRYRNLIVRSVEDKAWPNVDEVAESGISSWLKMEPWDFYDNGIEFISMGLHAIFDDKGHWDLAGLSDKREKRPDYKVVTCHPFARIPFDFIVDLDMETDPYYGVPTLYVEYAKDGMPYEEIKYGLMGVYRMKRYRQDFDPDMRRNLP
jgi:hypothetical protein